MANGYIDISNLNQELQNIITNGGGGIPQRAILSVNGIEADGNGNVQLPSATNAELGLIKVDGTTIVSNNGIISAIGGASGSTWGSF